MPSVPLAVSSQSRKKLRSFQYVGEEDEIKVVLSDDLSSTSVKPHALAPDQYTETVETIFPQTPAVKIPIQDLIGNTEDAFNCSPPITTPKDHVLWQNNTDSSERSESAITTEKNRKRTHSSSPASSQVAAGRDALNLESVRRSLRTPNNDPTQDLWNRYTTANMAKKGDGEPTLPTLPHLLPSSPQTPGTTSRDGGLRRTVSCGVEWPTSRPKRQRMDVSDLHSRTKDIFAASKKDILAHEVPRNSRVGLLVEKIQESLTRKVVTDEGPSSSSPLPDRHSQVALSPTRPQSRGVQQPHENSQGLNVDGVSPWPRPAPQDESSEFGDDGLDIEFFESVELSLTQSHAPGKGVTLTTNPIALDENGRALGAAQKPSSPRKDLWQPLGSHRTRQALSPVTMNGQNLIRRSHDPPTDRVQQTFDDEFDDEDDDEAFTAELQHLAEKYDSQDAPFQHLAPRPSQPHTSHSTSQRRLGTIDEFGDVFDDDDDDYLWQNGPDERGSARSGSTCNTENMNNRAIKRYLILDVLESQYETSQGRKRPEKMLSVRDERTSMLYVVLLRQSWYETRCTKGSYVHVIGHFDHTGQCIVDDVDNMIILHPDHLISSTVVGDSFTCTRRAVLQDRVKATGTAEKPQVYGHILHEMFGEALKKNKWDSESFQVIIDHVLPKYVESLYEIGVLMAEAREHLMSKVPDLRGWASIFVTDQLSRDAVIRDRNGMLVPMAIQRLLDLEEHVWSPMYGLKGNVDATIQVQMQLPGEGASKTLLVPLELKTGKKDNVEQHRVQTALYTLLLSDRYDVSVTCGVLYYLETSKTFRVERVRNEIRHMIIERNELACYVHDKLALPPMIKRPHLCKGCYSKVECWTYHKLSEGGNAESSGMGDTFNELVGHLTAAHQDFFKKWDDLLTREERDSMKFRRELWTMLGSEREAVGRCFSALVIEPGSAHENDEGTKINRFEYTFVKHRAQPGFSFTESQITIGEPIVISDEKGHFNFATGYVLNVRPTRIVVAVDRRLQTVHRRMPGFDPINYQAFAGNLSSPKDRGQAPPIVYRIDKDEFANGMATARNNLIRMMEKTLWRARELRQLIVENRPPEFKAESAAYALSGPASQQDLNVDQRRAIEKVMRAKDYALVLGMPGTGKTTTIAHIIRALVSQNKSVLLASYTHTAVDNILLKIRDDNIPIFRIGSVNKVHREVQSFADISGVPKRTMEELHRVWQESKVVATTCLGVNHGIFNARTFNYCIVDEASQITLPVCLGPIRMARTFILVGDHYQLPPLVQNKEAQEGGLDVSLFKLLSDAQPDSVVHLEHQYRMADDIMLLSKELVYAGRLKCGTPSVAKRTLPVSDLETGLRAHHFTASTVHKASQSNICLASSTCWLRQALDPQSRCLFLNTDTVAPAAEAGREAVSGSRITNPVESTLTAQLVTTLIRSGVSPRAIGVITFYRSQLALLRRDVKYTAGGEAATDVEMHTADKYQGRDKEVVILSCVRSNPANHVGELLKDWRRVNVAVTRARSKLLIIGSKGTMHGSGVAILEGIVKIMDGKGWILDLPDSAVEGQHMFESLSQFSQTPRSRLESKAALPGMKKDTSPGKKIKPKTNQSDSQFRQPAKVVRGGVDMEKLLEKRPVLRDVVNEAVLYPSDRKV